MYRLRILGGIALEGPSEGPAVRLSSRRAEAVLAVLAVAGDLGCTRERLLGLLWSESDELHARHGLRDALHAVRLALGPSAVVAVGDVLRLGATDLVTDLGEFEHALRRRDCAAAAAAYGGPLLDGVHVDDAPEFERWLDDERARLARAFGDALESLAEEAESDGDWRTASEWWERTVAHDPLNTRVVRRHLRALAIAGDRANGLRAADLHRRRLRAELGVDPGAAFNADVERLRSGGVPDPPEPARRSRAVTPAASPPGSAPANPVAADPVTSAPRDKTRSAGPISGGDWLTDSSDAWRRGLAAGRAGPPQARAISLRRLVVRSVVAVPVLLGLGLGVALAVRRAVGSRGAAGETGDVIAVLPFGPLAGDSSHRYIAAALSEDVASVLATLLDSAVTSPPAVARVLAAGPRRPTEIGHALGARYLLDGTLHLAYDSVRLSARLLDARTEARVWAGRYDCAVRDLPRLAAEIAVDVRAWLGRRRRSPVPAARVQPVPRSLDADRAYRRGNARLAVRRADANRGAAAEYVHALSLDGGFQAARARLAIAEVQQVDYGWLTPGVEPDRQLAAALARADTAIVGEPGLASGWVARCYTLWLMRRLPEALAACRRAVSVDPSDEEACCRHGKTLMLMGRDSAAGVESERCRQLDPGWHVPRYALAMLDVQAGRLADALAHLDEVVRLAPDYGLGRYVRGRVRLRLGDTAGARQDLESVRGAADMASEAMVLEGLLEARAGRPRAARVLAARLSLVPESKRWGRDPWVGAAMVYVALGDREAALRELARATPYWVDLRAPEFDALRADVRFQLLEAAIRARDAAP